MGARLLQGFDPTGLAEALPRLGEAELFAAVGLPVVSPATDDELSGLGVDALARHVANVRIARAIGTSEPPGASPRLAATSPDPRLEAAVRRWVAIRRAASAEG